MDVIHVPLNDILADNDFNCREKVNPIQVRELAMNIRENELLQPVVVRPMPENKKKQYPDKKYHLVAGYRRYTAYTLLNKEQQEDMSLSEAERNKFSAIPANLKNFDDTNAFKMNLSENISRQNLNIKEEAKAVSRLRKLGYTQAEVSDMLGMSRGWTQLRSQMCDLEEDIQEAIVLNNMTTTQMTQIWQLDTYEQRCEAIRNFKERKSKGEKVKNVVDKIRNPNKKVIPKKQDILLMMDIISGEPINLGYGFPTRILAWAMGGITDNELIQDAKEFSAKYKKLEELAKSV